MIIHTSIFALPLLIVVWSLDLYVFLACIRLSLSRFGGARAQAACAWLRQVTDSIPQRVELWLARRSRDYPPKWVPWVIVMAGCIALRYLIFWFVVRVL